MSADVPEPLHPPRGVPGFALNDWFTVSGDGSTTVHLATHLWDRPQPPAEWEAARLSRAIYLFRERATGWTVLVKYYRKKVDDPAAAVRWATNEEERTRQAADLLGDDALRPPRVLGRLQDVLFLEHVDGLTLEDAIAVRRNRPGLLPTIITDAARLLATLHSNGREPDAPRDPGLLDAHRFVRHLADSGVLQDDAVVRDALRLLLDRWAATPLMADYLPAWIHGDATTSNFIIPRTGGVVAIDWERMHVADPAAELGRLLAEITHAVDRYGGTGDEGAEVAALATAAYVRSLPPEWDAAALAHRARVHQAGSTLRIARNGWLTREDRMGLVARALALLAA